jgi:hypothetical protein
MAIFSRYASRVDLDENGKGLQLLRNLDVLFSERATDELTRTAAAIWTACPRSPVQTAVSRMYAACAHFIEGNRRAYQTELSRALFVLCSVPSFEEQWLGDVVTLLFQWNECDMGNSTFNGKEEDERKQ